MSQRRHPVYLVACLLGLLCVVASVPALASGKYALVVGNAHYQGADRLLTPDNDAALMARRLKRLGFVVALHTDRSRRDFLADLDAFVLKAQDADMVVFYYAGHGFEVGGDNFLIPVDVSAPLNRLHGNELRHEGVALRNVRAALARTGANTRLLFIDACRTAPERGTRARGMGKTLAGNGVLLAWSTAPGSAAVDSMRALGHDVDNSPFAWYLAHALADGDTGIVQVLRRVQQQVVTATGDSQRPWFTSGLVGTVTLGGPNATSVGVTAGTAVTAHPLIRGINRSENTAARHLWDHENHAITRALRALDVPMVQSLQRRARAGDSRAATILGDAFAAGIVVHRDPNQALAHYRGAVDAGYVPAKTRLGEAYVEGRMVPRDLSRAERLLQQAADADATRAIIDLAQVRNERGEAGAMETNLRALRQMGASLRDALRQQAEPDETRPAAMDGNDSPTH